MRYQITSKALQVMALSVTALLAACNDGAANRADEPKKGSSQTSNAQICGTNMVVENPAHKTNSKALYLNVRPQICGRIAGSKQVWSALGKGVVTNEIYLSANTNTMEQAKKYQLITKGKEVYAVHGNEQIKVGVLNQNKHAYPITLEKGINAQIGSSVQEGYDLDTKMVEPKDPRVFLIKADQRKK